MASYPLVSVTVMLKKTYFPGLVTVIVNEVCLNIKICKYFAKIEQIWVIFSNSKLWVAILVAIHKVLQVVENVNKFT